MKAKIILTLTIIIGSIFQSMSQNYIKLINDSIYWDIAYAESTYICPGFSDDTPRRFYFNGDTVIHNGLVPLTEVMLASGDIVTDCCADGVPLQPPVMVYIILHVPAVTPVTRPAALTVATAGLLLLHAPVPPPSTTPLAL